MNCTPFSVGPPRCEPFPVLALEARTSHWVSIAANDRGTSPQEVLTTQELLGCSRSIGPIRPCGRNPEIGRVTGIFAAPVSPPRSGETGAAAGRRSSGIDTGTGVVDEPFGPARALRDVWTSGGRGWRLAHRVDHTRVLLAHRHHRTTTTPILSIFGFHRPDGRREGGPNSAGASQTDHGHRVHRGVEIRVGLACARSGLAFGQPAGIKKEDRTQASVRERLAR